MWRWTARYSAARTTATASTPTIISASATTFKSAPAPASPPPTSTACTFASFLVSYLVETDPPVSLTYSTYVTLTGFAHFLFFLLHKRLWHACRMLLSLQQ